MDEKIRKWLFAILTSLNEIDEYFISAPKKFSTFKKDIKTKRAIERNIEIISDSITKIINLQPDITISNSKKIVDAKNYIINGYDKISDDIIWAIVMYYLPKLKSETEELLNL